MIGIVRVIWISISYAASVSTFLFFVGRNQISRRSKWKICAFTEQESNLATTAGHASSHHVLVTGPGILNQQLRKMIPHTLILPHKIKWSRLYLKYWLMLRAIWSDGRYRLILIWNSVENDLLLPDLGVYIIHARVALVVLWLHAMGQLNNRMRSFWFIFR